MKTRLTALLVAASGLLAACDSVTVPEREGAEVYDFRLLTSPPSVLRWPTGSTIRVYVHGGGDVARADELHDATRHAVRAWNEAVRFGEYRVVISNAVEAADAVVMWSTDTAPVEITNCVPSGGRAFTTFCLTESGDRLEPFPIPDMNSSSVRFLVTIRTAEAGDAAHTRALVAHEIGHVLGIAQHSSEVADLMYDGELLRDAPNVRDRATIQVLYHAQPDIVP